MSSTLPFMSIIIKLSCTVVMPLLVGQVRKGCRWVCITSDPSHYSGGCVLVVNPPTILYAGGSIFHKVIFGGNEDSFQPD
jgi:hypothetical protein